jgi:8-oxo-dGTP pyrophosphatase MutT (NUDIX family)
MDVPAGMVADVERTSVRIVLVDASGRILLFRTVDPFDAGLGTWWELPGGGMEPGESVAATASRELAEETGFVLAPEAFGPPSWTRTATYLRRGRRVLQHELVVRGAVPGQQPLPRADARTPEELEDYTGHRWWTVDEVVASTERFFPGRLPRLLPAFLSGSAVAEPFEWWN